MWMLNNLKEAQDITITQAVPSKRACVTSKCVRVAHGINMHVRVQQNAVCIGMYIFINRQASSFISRAVNLP